MRNPPHITFPTRTKSSYCYHGSRVPSRQFNCERENRSFLLMLSDFYGRVQRDIQSLSHALTRRQAIQVCPTRANDSNFAKSKRDQQRAKLLFLSKFNVCAESHHSPFFFFFFTFIWMLLSTSDLPTVLRSWGGVQYVLRTICSQRSGRRPSRIFTSQLLDPSSAPVKPDEVTRLELLRLWIKRLARIANL